MRSVRNGRPPAADLPPGVYSKTKTLKNGRVAEYYYHRKGGRIDAQPGTAKFDAEVRRMNSTAVPAIIENSWGDLVASYRAAPEYRDLKPNTKAYYDRALLRLDGLRSCPLTEIRRRDLLEIRDAIAATHRLAANQFVMVIGVALAFAVERHMIEYNPLKDVRRLPGRTHQTWTEPQVNYALAHFAEPYRRAVLLASHLGQRESDLVKMTWSDFDGAQIRVQQKKTKGEEDDRTLWIPCLDELVTELNAWKGNAAPSDTILQNTRGREWPVNSFAQIMSLRIAEHEALKGLVFHGIRKAAATRLADVGCTEHEIMSITGHTSLAEVQRYTRAANQKRLARSAMEKVRMNGTK